MPLPPSPVDVDAALVPEHSFSLQEFGDLVSSALDIQRVPDSALTLSYGGSTSSPLRRRPRSGSRRGKDTRLNASGPLARLRNAFMKKTDLPNASPSNINLHRPLPDHQILRLASSSAPVLSLLTSPFQELANASASLSDLSNFNQAVLSGMTTASSSASANSESFPFPVLAPSQNVVEQRTHLEEHQLHEEFQTTRSRASSRTFFGLKPHTMPNLAKKSSKIFFSSGSPSQLRTKQIADSYANSSLPSIDLSQDDPSAMRSFFDDSGYGDDALLSSQVARKKSKPGLRSFFQNNLFTGKKSVTRTDSRTLERSDKSLPPTPPSEEQPFFSNPYRNCQVIHAPTNGSFARRKLTDDYGSLFYIPQADTATNYLPQSTPEREASHTITAHENHPYGKSNRISKSSDPMPQKSKGDLRCSLPLYPSPKLPLPPTPELSPKGLPAVSPPNSDHYHAMDCGDVERGEEGSDQSIDSIEIMSWRMPALEQQASKSSTASSDAQAHALGRPSRSSIRQRLGLGPRLQVHVPLPTQTQMHSFLDAKTISPSPSKDTKTLSRLTVPPTSGVFSVSAKVQASRLASISLVSLRSIATITANNNQNCGCESPDSERRSALNVDRVLTPENDPFAALTPISPLVSARKSKKDMEYRSFMRLGNDSTASLGTLHTPNSAPANFPIWDAHFGSRSSLSSSTQTTPISARSVIQYPTRTRTPSPLSAHIALPSSLGSAPGPRPRMLSSQSFPRSSSRHNLANVIAMARKTQDENRISPRSKMSGSSDENKGIVGHSDSRPNSPFPMLFLRSQAKKTETTFAKERSSSSNELGTKSTTTNCSGVRENSGIIVRKPVLRPILTRKIQGVVREPLPLSAGDADAFGDACSGSGAATLKEVQREVVSPTAYLLESEDYYVSGDVNGGAVVDKSNVLELELIDDAVDEGDRDRSKRLNDQSDTFHASQENQVTHRVLAPTESETETETETETDIDFIQGESRIWPLPPHRTVVVDEENGEGWHVVEPTIEYVQLDGAVPDAFRHYIRTPNRHSGSASVQGFSRRSSGSGSTSQKLSTRQARLIAERLGYAIDKSCSIVDSSAIDLSTPPQHPYHQLRQRARSTTSLVSNGNRSHKTCKSAYYTVRSSVSRGSNQSTSSSIQSRMNANLSREGSFRSATSSCRPTSGNSGKSASSMHTGNKPGGFSYCPKHLPFEVDSSNQPNRGSVFCGSHKRGVDVLPQRIVLRRDPPDNTLKIIADGLAGIMAVCKHNSGVRFEAESEGPSLSASGALLRVSLKKGKSEADVIQRIRPDEPVSLSGPGSNPDISIHWQLFLTLHGSESESEASADFCIPLPVTLEGIADRLQEMQNSTS